MTERLKNPVPQFFDDSGDPLISGKLYFYETGTGTLKNTYADVGLAIPNSNPVILDASGRAPNIFLNGVYKVKLTTSDETQEWERDSVGEVSDVQFSGWDSTKTYGVADIVQGSNLVYYRSLVAANINFDPVTNPAKWEEILVVGEDATGRGSDYVPWVGQAKTVTAALDDHESRIAVNEGLVPGIAVNAQNITDQGDGTDAMPSPAITSFENSLHDHSDAAGGGLLTFGLQSVQVFTAAYPTTAPGLAIGTTATDIANDAFNYVVDGQPFSKGANAAGTAPGTDVIPQGTFGAVALDIDAAGSITVTTAADNATGYASAGLAVAGIPAVIAPKARIGTVTVTKSDSSFIFGNTDLDAANTTVVYTDAQLSGATWTKPVNVTNVLVEVVGGGGGGGAGDAGNTRYGGGGGGGGAAVELLDVTGDATGAVTVGVAGSASSFILTTSSGGCSATGGATGDAAGVQDGKGGAGGLGADGDLNLKGQGGGTGSMGGSAVGWSGGGGGEANPSAAGTAGGNYGGGGGGGGDNGTAGGAGAGGIVVIWEYK